LIPDLNGLKRFGLDGPTHIHLNPLRSGIKFCPGQVADDI